MLTVFGVLAADRALTPVSFVKREPNDETSSIRSAEPSLSSVNESTSAMGLQPVDWVRG